MHVTRSDGLTGASPADLAAQRLLVETLGGTYHQVVGDDVADALLTFARAENATQLVLGASRRSRLAALLPARASAPTTIRDSGDIDVHLVTHAPDRARAAGCPRLRGGLTRRRRLQGSRSRVLLPPLLTLAAGRRTAQHLNLVSDVLLFLLVVVVVALVGGFLPGHGGRRRRLPAAQLLLRPAAAPFTIRETNNVLALVVFVVVAVLVSSVVDLAARRTRQAARATAEAETLGTLAGSVLRGETALPALLERVREAFGLTSVTLLERRTAADDHHGAAARGPADEWTVVASAGTERVRAPRGRRHRGARRRQPRARPARAPAAGRGPARPRRVRRPGGRDPRAAPAGRGRSRRRAAGRGDRTRTALLAAVGHDLRSPLASAKAAVTSLRSKDVELDAAGPRRAAATADESLDQLARLVDNLLDMSRLQAGAMSVLSRPVALEDVVPLALDELGPSGRRVVVDVPDDLPTSRPTPGLLERVVANLVANALRYAPPDAPPVVTASASATGWSSGSSTAARASRRPTWNGSSRPSSASATPTTPPGSGLGLALSRGLTEAMGGTPHPGGDPGRRPDDGRLAARRAARTSSGGDATRPARAGRRPRTSRPRPVGTAHDPGARGRRRAADPARPVDQPAGPPLRGDHGRHRRRGAPAAARDRPDLVILDLGLPDLDGVDVVRGLRGWSSAPIIILSGRSDSADKVDALDAGADDYLTKPFGVDELLARIRAVSRRATPADSTPVVTFGTTTVGPRRPAGHGHRGSGRDDVRLTPTEWHLLEVLLRHPGKLLSQRQLLAEVWGPGYETAGGNLSVYMAQLRRKLEPNPGRPRHLLTEPGMGYRFQPDAGS